MKQKPEKYYTEVTEVKFRSFIVTESYIYIYMNFNNKLILLYEK